MSVWLAIFGALDPLLARSVFCGPGVTPGRPLALMLDRIFLICSPSCHVDSPARRGNGPSLGLFTRS